MENFCGFVEVRSVSGEAIAPNSPTACFVYVCFGFQCLAMTLVTFTILHSSIYSKHALKYV